MQWLTICSSYHDTNWEVEVKTQKVRNFGVPKPYHDTMERFWAKFSNMFIVPWCL